MDDFSERGENGKLAGPLFYIIFVVEILGNIDFKSFYHQIGAFRIELCQEVIASTGHTNAVDWWTLGILIFELMAGHPPFESAYPMQIYAKVTKGALEILEHWNMGQGRSGV